MKNIVIEGSTFRVCDDFEEKYDYLLSDYQGRRDAYESLRDENLASGNYYGNDCLATAADEAFDRLFDAGFDRGDIYFLCTVALPNAVRL